LAEWRFLVAKKIKERSPAPGLTTPQRVELHRLLGQVPPFEPLPVRDIGPNAPRALLEALEFVFGHGVTTGERMRAYPCRGGEWVIDSRVLADLQLLAGLPKR